MINSCVFELSTIYQLCLVTLIYKLFSLRNVQYPVQKVQNFKVVTGFNWSIKTERFAFFNHGYNKSKVINATCAILKNLTRYELGWFMFKSSKKKSHFTRFNDVNNQDYNPVNFLTLHNVHCWLYLHCWLHIFNMLNCAQ